MVELCFDERKDKKTGQAVPVEMLVFHCSAYPAKKLIQVFKDLSVSAHYIIDIDGTIIQLLDESKRAWHAGTGSWNKIDDINSHSIGIEIINPSLGHSIPYPEKQIDAVIELSKKIIQKYHISPHNILAHSDMAPSRRYDPGRLFPWEKLAKEGIGLWPTGTYKCPNETDVKQLLSDIGYPVENKGASLKAFYRHFMPEMIPDEENPPMKQYDFLVEYEKNLPYTLDQYTEIDERTIERLNQVACLFKKSRSQK